MDPSRRRQAAQAADARTPRVPIPPRRSTCSVATRSREPVDLRLQRYEPDGAEGWSRQYAGPGGGNDSRWPDRRPPMTASSTWDRRRSTLDSTAWCSAYDSAGNVLFRAPSSRRVATASLGALAAAESADIVAAGRAKSETDSTRWSCASIPPGRRVAPRLRRRRALRRHGDDEATRGGGRSRRQRLHRGPHLERRRLRRLRGEARPRGQRALAPRHRLRPRRRRAWSAAFDAPGAGGAPGSLWIAGRASNGNDTDALTLRLDADGNELFRSLVAGTEQRDDEHYDLVIGPTRPRHRRRRLRRDRRELQLPGHPLRDLAARRRLRRRGERVDGWLADPALDVRLQRRGAQRPPRSIPRSARGAPPRRSTCTCRRS